MNMPLVSVVIPTHNRCQFLPTAIRSVLNQTFRDFEVLVVDDGSGDATPMVRNEFADPRIRWFRHATAKGGGAARNKGIREAKGELIAFLDDDDEWYPEKLMRQLVLMSECPANVGAVYTGYVVVDRSSGKVHGRMIPKLRGNLNAELLRSNPIGGTSSILIKRRCLETVGLFDEALPSFQDRDLWIRISREYHFDFIQEPLLNYFIHSRKIWTDLEALIRGLEIMLAKHGSSNAFRKQCSRRYMEFGIKLCEAKQVDEGRKLLRRAIGLSPLWIKPYVYFSFALIGARGFAIVRDACQKVFARQGLENG